LDALVGKRSISNGANAAAASRKNTPRPIARPIGGSQSQRPSQETPRKSPMTVAIEASGGHSRSQKIVRRARLSAGPSASPRARPGAAARRRGTP